MINVCIIDDGIDEKFLKKSMLYDFEVSENSIVTKKICLPERRKSHGTICARIICKYSPNASISSIRLHTDSERASRSKHLLTALDYCRHMDIDIIHMSLGSTAYSDIDSIHKVIQELSERGVIIIAACNNKNTFTVPACLPEVIGVCTKRGFEGEYYEINKNNCDGIDFVASSKHMIDERITPVSNSCAAPLITAKACNFLIDNPKAGFREVRDYLVENAGNYSDESDCLTREDLIKTKPEDLDCRYGSVIRPKDRENPLICFYEYPMEGLINLKNIFIQNGYNCLLITNHLLDDFIESEYINFSNSSIIENALKTLNTVYNPDLLIVGVYGLPDFGITDYIDADIVCKDGLLTTDEGEAFEMSKDLFSQLYSILGGEDA